MIGSFRAIMLNRCKNQTISVLYYHVAFISLVAYCSELVLKNYVGVFAYTIDRLNIVPGK